MLQMITTIALEGNNNYMYMVITIFSDENFNLLHYRYQNTLHDKTIGIAWFGVCPFFSPLRWVKSTHRSNINIHVVSRGDPG